MTTTCPTTDDLRALLEDRLPTDHESAVLAHVEGCPACQHALESLTAADLPSAVLLARPTRAAPPEGGSRPSASGESGGRPERIGPYRIGREIGRGGMGVVYLATHTRLRREAAVKLIRAGASARPEDVARFRREAEAVAAVGHPNVVTVYEAGEQDGVPWLALEYVPGGSLREYLGGRPLAPRAAAEVARGLARGAAAVHAAGVVHRDIKPANVMLAPAADGPAVPKLTDFGLAKDVAGAVVTVSGEVLGTPHYMAPEQARGQAGPAADVYGIGAVLYEALTGSPPFNGTDPVAVLHLVATRDPVPVRRLQPSVPRDLQTVCHKCLEKDPARRYVSAAALADDLDRFLDGRPIVARPLGPLGAGLRRARRNPVPFALAFALVAAVAAGVAGVAWKWREAAAERDAAVEARGRAADEAAAAEEASAFLAGMLEPDDGLAFGNASFGFRGRGGQALLARDLVARGVARLENDAVLRGRPLVRARLLHQVGTLSFGLGDLPTARRLLGEALALRRAHLPPDHPDLARTLTAGAHAGYLAEDPDAADKYREAIRIFRAVGPDGPGLAEAETGLALCATLWDVTEDEAGRLILHAAEVHRARPGKSDFRTVSHGVIHAYLIFALPGLRDRHLAEAVRIVGEVGARLDQSEAEPGLKELVRIAARTAVRTAPAYALLGPRAAIPGFREFIGKAERVLGPGHYFTLIAKADLAGLLYENPEPGRPRADFEECARLLGECLDGLKGWGVPLPLRAGRVHMNLGRALLRLNRPAEAEPHLRQAVELFRRGVPWQSADLPHALQALAISYARSGDPVRSELVPGVLVEALAACRSNPRVPAYRLGHQLVDLGQARLSAGQAAEAAALFAEAAEVRRKDAGPDSVGVGEALAFRVAALRAAGDEAAAARAWAEFRPFARAVERHPKLSACRSALSGGAVRWWGYDP
jgi:tetratricopeptide (TPR) repeat protein